MIAPVFRSFILYKRTKIELLFFPFYQWLPASQLACTKYEIWGKLYYNSTSKLHVSLRDLGVGPVLQGHEPLTKQEESSELCIAALFHNRETFFVKKHSSFLFCKLGPFEFLGASNHTTVRRKYILKILPTFFFSAKRL